MTSRTICRPHCAAHHVTLSPRTTEAHAMRWEGERESSNVEDRRGMPVKGMAAGGGLVTLIIVLIAMFTGRDPRPLLNQVNGGGGGASPAAQQQVDPRDEPLKKFVGVV